MVDYRGNRKPPAYLSRRQQGRLLLLFAMLALVLLLMSEAAKPENWYWLWGGSAPNAQVSQSNRGPSAGSSGLFGPDQTDIDTSLPLDDAQRPAPGVLVSPVPDPAGDADDRERKSEYFAGVRPELLKDVRDAAPFRRDGAAAWNNFVDVLSENDQATLDAASIGYVTMAQLYQQPNVYRGKLVSVRGVVRRVNRKELPKKKPGIDVYYQIWLQPLDNPLSPMVIYTLDLPREFPTGNELREEAQITGFFFKLWAYQAQDKIRTAPLIVARTFDWTKPAVAPARTWSTGRMLSLVASAAVLAMILVAWALYSTWHRRKAGLAGRFTRPLPQDVTNLDELETAPVPTFDNWEGEQNDSPTTKVDES